MGSMLPGLGLSMMASKRHCRLLLVYMMNKSFKFMHGPWICWHFLFFVFGWLDLLTLFVFPFVVVVLLSLFCNEGPGLRGL